MKTNSIRVLLVDDDNVMLRSLKRALSEHDLEVETSTCAAEAAVMLKHCEYDVLVCDQNMPGKTGLELLSELQSEGSELITMMLSGQISGVSVAEDWAREIGVQEVIAKPCDANFIADRIKKLVNHQRSLHLS